MMRHPSHVPICQIIPQKIRSTTINNQARNNASSYKLTIKPPLMLHDALWCPTLVTGVSLGIFGELGVLLS